MQLEMRLTSLGDGQAMLTVTGPEEAIVAIFANLTMDLATDPEDVQRQVREQTGDVGDVGPS